MDNSDNFYKEKENEHDKYLREREDEATEIYEEVKKAMRAAFDKGDNYIHYNNFKNSNGKIISVHDYFKFHRKLIYKDNDKLYVWLTSESRGIGSYNYKLHWKSRNVFNDMYEYVSDSLYKMVSN